MTTEIDPYAAPTARILGHTRSGRMRIEGKCLVAPLGATLPPICVITGKPQVLPGSRQSKTLTWSPPWVALLFLVNVLLMLIVSYFTRKTTLVSYSIEPDLHRERVRRKWIASGVTVGGLLLMFAAIPTEVFDLVFVGLFLFLTGLVMFMTWARGLWARRMEGAYVYIRGIDPDAMLAIVLAADAQEASEPDWRAQMFPGRA
jgi:hypothetical protein